MKSYLLAGLVALMLLSSCAFQSDSYRIGHLPTCDIAETGRLLLIAQSVPTAEVLPCIEHLPTGWIFEHAEVESGRSRLQFDNAAGTDVVVSLLHSCTPSGKRTGTEAGITSYESIDEAGTVVEHVFQGGCIRIEIPPEAGANQMADAIGLLSREALRAESGWELDF